jgi:hypothetical protein
VDYQEPTTLGARHVILRRSIGVTGLKAVLFDDLGNGNHRGCCTAWSVPFSSSTRTSNSVIGLPGHHFSLADAGRKLAHARQAADRLVLGAGYKDTGLVVVDALGRPMRPSGYSDRFVLLCSDAGVRQVHLHAVRHTLALMMHRAGIAPADAAALLGHTVQTHLRLRALNGERCTDRRQWARCSDCSGSVKFL